MEELNLRGERAIQAVRWITKIDSGDMTPHGWGEFVAWIVNDRENRAAFVEIEEMWTKDARIFASNGGAQPRQRPRAEVIPLFSHILGRQK
jgi:ferric-dicitrate binding protein FerR (iron transport regulator)